MSPGHTIGWQTFCAEMVHSTAGFSLCLYPTEYIDMFHEKMFVKDQLISCSPALWKCQSKPAIFSFTIILVIDFRSISFDHRCLITWLSFLKGFVQSYVWWGKASFGVTVWSSTWRCVNRWVGELLSGMMVFETTPEEAWATLSAINFSDVQVRHHGCFCGLA